MLRLVQVFSPVNYSNMFCVCQHEFKNQPPHSLLTTYIPYKKLHVNADERKSTLADTLLSL